ncbi:MAG: FAD-dependent oxidoreductase [Myxococcales bacterium]|nr:FAD-dependent oxidoreductase [Myxococcales bacterium]
MSTHPTAIVVGAGIAGLTAAFELQRAGWAVRVLESEPIVGGRMSSVAVGDFVLNRAASILPGSHDAIRDLARDVGLGELGRLDGPMGTLRDGVVHRVRSNHLAFDGMRSRLLSLGAKLRLGRLAYDGARIRGALSHDHLGHAAPFDGETAMDYARRRLGPEVAEYVVGPVARSLSDDASTVQFFFGAVLTLGTGFLDYPGGIGFLADALAEGLEICTHAPVHSVAREGGRVEVVWEHDGERQSDRVDGCVLAVPGCAVPDLYPQLAPQLAALLRGPLDYAPYLVSHFGLSVRPTEPCLAVLVPEAEDPALGAVVFSHNMRPTAAPPSKGLIAAYWAHPWCEQQDGVPDEALIAQMRVSVERIVPEVRDHTEMTHLTRWRAGALRGPPGFCEATGQLHEQLDPEAPIQLAGDYFTSSTTNGSVVSARRAAHRLLAQVPSG